PPRPPPRVRAREPLCLTLGLLLLPHHEHFLTVHLDGATISGCVALRLGSAALPPLPKLFLQVLEHPLLPPVGGRSLLAGRRVIRRDEPPQSRCTDVSSDRARFGLRSFRNALASICRMRSRVTAKRCPTSSSV